MPSRSLWSLRPLFTRSAVLSRRSLGSSFASRALSPCSSSGDVENQLRCVYRPLIFNRCLFTWLNGICLQYRDRRCLSILARRSLQPLRSRVARIASRSLWSLRPSFTCGPPFPRSPCRSGLTFRDPKSKMKIFCRVGPVRFNFSGSFGPGVQRRCRCVYLTEPGRGPGSSATTSAAVFLQIFNFCVVLL